MNASRPLPPAIVLTAGLGTRLAPLTDVRAKPAVPLAGTPLVIRILQRLAAQGVPHAVLNLHHRPETITGRVGHGHAVGLPVRYSWEPVVLGSAGGPRKALSLLGQRFFIVNGDTLSDVPLTALLDTHRSSGARVTLAVMPHPAPDRYGGVTVDSDGWATGFVRAGHGRPAHFVGVQVAERSVFALVPENEPRASIGDLYDQLIARDRHAVRVHEVDGTFHDIGTPRSYLSASVDVARTEGLATPVAGSRTRIHENADVTGCEVWDDVVIEAGCRLSGCVVTDGVRVPAGFVLTDHVIVDGRRHEPGGDQRRVGDLLVSRIA